jgi:hypothetical protein
MELHELVNANIKVFVEPCELFLDYKSGDRILTCKCKPIDIDDMEDIVQAIIDICCLDIYNDDFCKKYTIEITYTTRETGDVIVITKTRNKTIIVVIDNGEGKVKRVIGI